MRNRELSAIEMASIKRACDKWGFLFKISKLQILVIDKLLATCHHETNIYEDGELLKVNLKYQEVDFLTLFLYMAFLTHLATMCNNIMQTMMKI